MKRVLMAVTPSSGFDGGVLDAEMRHRDMGRDQAVFGFPDELGDTADGGGQWQPDPAGFELEDPHRFDELAAQVGQVDATLELFVVFAERFGAEAAADVQPEISTMPTSAIRAALRCRGRRCRGRSSRRGRGRGVSATART